MYVVKEYSRCSRYITLQTNFSNEKYNIYNLEVWLVLIEHGIRGVIEVDLNIDFETNLPWNSATTLKVFFFSKKNKKYHMQQENKKYLSDYLHNILTPLTMAPMSNKYIYYLFRITLFFL